MLLLKILLIWVKCYNIFSAKIFGFTVYLLSSEGVLLRPAPTRREPKAYRPKRHKAVDARLDNCPTRRYLACLKSGASCSTLLATERSWPRVSATALTHWSITIGSLWPDASSGRWGRVAAGSQLHTDACWTRLVGAGLYSITYTLY